MSKPYNISLNNILVVLIFAVLLAYVIIRAYTLSFTHDESVSFTIVQGDHAWRNTANNHLLNTLFMSLSKMAFGISEFSLRLPNVILFTIYLTGSFFIFKRSNKIWLSLLAIALTLFNPFLIEFFSLARGYGISLGFMILSLYFMLRNKPQDSNSSELLKDFMLTSLFASLAIYANLAIINYFICVLLIFSIKYWLFKKVHDTSINFNIKFWGIVVISTIPILLGVLRLLKLKEMDQLYFGAANLIDGFDSLTLSSIYFKENASFIVLTVKILVVLSFIISFLYIFIKKKYNGGLFLVTMLLLFLALGLYLEDIFFDAKYPAFRTALFYIPILAIFIYHLFKAIVEHYNIKSRYYAPIILCLVVPLSINFVASANFSYTTSWKYDSHTKDVMKVIEKYIKNDDAEKTISNHWLFEPTINYYINRWELNLDLTNRNGIDRSTDFIYKLDDTVKIDGFETVKVYSDIESELLVKSETSKE